MTASGHLRKWGAALGMSAPGGETDVIEQKADFHADHPPHQGFPRPTR